MAKLAVVAVQSNMIGRKVMRAQGYEHMWPFGENEYAEIVGLYVGDMQDGGVLKFVLCSDKDGKVREAYSHAFLVTQTRS